MTDQLQILILEDVAADAELMVRALRAGGFSFVHTQVSTESTFIAALRDCPPDIILADYALPAYDGLSALRFAEQRHPEVPFIFVSGSLGEETAIDALHHGATDYVLKHRLDRLGPAVRRALREIDDRRRRDDAEKALRESEERFRSIVDHVTDGILLVDPFTGMLAMANRTMCALLGYTDDELMQLGVHDVHAATGLPAIEAAFQRDRSGESVVTHDLVLRRKDGIAFFADVNATPVTILGRQFVMMNIRDVTERRALQAGMAKSDRLASMGMLAAGVAHEINNPLSYVLYNLETLVEELTRLTGGDEGAVDLLRSANDALAGTKRIKDIALGLSALSRIDLVERGGVDLRNVIECAVSMARHEIRYRARLVTTLEPVPAVWASEGRLTQVFLNLLVNAAHAIAEGNVDHNSITVHTYAEGGHVIAEVTDTGIGIPPENLERIFAPFFTTKPVGVGSGLGLSISMDIIRGYGGDLRVESQVGHGTRFIVRLPVMADVPAQPRHAVEPTAPSGPTIRGRVLVVDDDESIRRMLHRMLSHQHDVVTAASGAEGQRLLEEDRSFDVILCDLMMPEMTGVDLHAWLVARDPALAAQVVFMTGGAFTARTVEYLERVPNLRLHKPLSADEIRRVVMDRLLESRRTRRPTGAEER